MHGKSWFIGIPDSLVIGWGTPFMIVVLTDQQSIKNIFDMNCLGHVGQIP